MTVLAASLTVSPLCLSAPQGRHSASMVVVFELVAQGQNGDVRVVLDLEQRDVAGSSERNDQFAQERALSGLAARERRRLQRRDAGPQSRDGLRRQHKVTAVTSQFTLQQEVEKPIQVRLSVPGQPNLERHLPFFARRVRAASSLRCRLSTTTSAST